MGAIRAAVPEGMRGPARSGPLRCRSGRSWSPLDESGLTWGGYPLEHFVSTTTLESAASGTATAAPASAPLWQRAWRRRRRGETRRGGTVGPRTKVPVTALVRFEHARASLASGQVRGRLELYAADQATTVTVDGRQQPLEADPTAALAYQLEGNPFYALEIAAFLRAGAFGGQLPHDRAQDGLFTFQPYRPGKIPVVLVHGTASSPVRWAELINELEGDPRIRERFQIWIFLYDTGNPIGYSAGRLRAALTAAVQEFDPEGTDAALRRMVVIGHSQGGLLTKLTAIDSGTRFWDRISSKPFDAVKLSSETRDLLRQSTFFTPLPFVRRVVFVATPHHGALMAAGRLGAIAAWLVSMPVGLVGELGEALRNRDAKLAAALRRPPTAVDNMDHRTPPSRSSNPSRSRPGFRRTRLSR